MSKQYYIVKRDFDWLGIPFCVGDGLAYDSENRSLWMQRPVGDTILKLPINFHVYDDFMNGVKFDEATVFKVYLENGNIAVYERTGN